MAKNASTKTTSTKPMSTKVAKSTEEQNLYWNEKERKMELLMRALGIRHKLKVHESMKAPDNHEDLAILMLNKWELEDELRAIEDIMGDARLVNVHAKKEMIQREGVKLSKNLRGKKA